MGTSDLTLVIPSRNEAGLVEHVVREWWQHRPMNLGMGIVVVDDGSVDGTQDALTKLSKEIPIEILRNPTPLGYGGALRRGIAHARTQWVACTDGDGQYDPKDLEEVLRPLTSGVELSLGHRTRRADPLIRKVVSRSFRGLLRMLFGLRSKDPSTALKAGRTDVFQSIAEQTCHMDGSFWQEFVLRSLRAGYSWAEVPIRHRPRAKGESKIASNSLLPSAAVRQTMAALRLWREFRTSPNAPPESVSGGFTMPTAARR